jgi:NAD(P)-dependent dehydrogenase (short-subunit alcohol dehydrogenase family)
MQDLANKIAFITGGAGGIGFSIAHALAQAGMDIAIADIDAQRLQSAKKTLAETGARVAAVTLNVTDYDDWQRAADTVERELGPVSLLVNSAGLGGSSKVIDEDVRRWKYTLEVNALGPFYGCRVFLPRMIKLGSACHIVNVASMAGLFAIPGISAYNTSKYALVGFSDTLRGELYGTNIALSVVYPGSTRTGFMVNSQQQLQRHAGIKVDENSDPALHNEGMDPDELAARVLQGIRDDEYHIFTHPAGRAHIEAFASERIAAFDGVSDPGYVEKRQRLAQMFRSVAESKV